MNGSSPPKKALSFSSFGFFSTIVLAVVWDSVSAASPLFVCASGTSFGFYGFSFLGRTNGLRLYLKMEFSFCLSCSLQALLAVATLSRGS